MEEATTNTNTLQQIFEESSITRADLVEQQSLLEPGAIEAAAAPQIQNVVAGVANFNFRGEQWHTFSFDIQTYVRPTRAVVMLALMNIFNNNEANDLRYQLGGYSLSYVGTVVRVTGRIYVGDSDGYLYGLSYICVVY